MHPRPGRIVAGSATEPRRALGSSGWKRDSLQTRKRNPQRSDSIESSRDQVPVDFMAIFDLLRENGTGSPFRVT